MEEKLDQLLTADNLRRLLQRKQIGEQPPWREKFGAKGRSRTFAAIDRLKSQGSLTVEEQLDAYGGGYASFVDVFVYPRDGLTATVRPGGHREIRGIRTYLAVNAPVAVYGASSVTRHATGSVWSCLDPDSLYRVAEGLHKTEQQVREGLTSSGFFLLPRSLAQRPLPFEAELNTNLGEPPYRVFDALFHWFD